MNNLGTAAVFLFQNVTGVQVQRSANLPTNRTKVERHPAASNMVAPNSLRGVSITGPLNPAYEGILTPEALSFIAHLARMYTPRVNELLARRQVVQKRFDAGERPHFLPETRRIRESDWKVSAF